MNKFGKSIYDFTLEKVANKPKWKASFSSKNCKAQTARI